MLSRYAVAIVPLYLFACMMLGNESSAAWTDAALEISGLAVIGWSAVTGRESSAPRARYFLLIAVLTAMFIALQAIRGHVILTGRAFQPDPEIYAGQHLAAALYRKWYALRAPVQAILWMLPPTAIFYGIVRLGPRHILGVVSAFLAGALGSVAIWSILQSGSAAALAGYHPPFTSIPSAGFTVRTGARGADLLVMSIPFVAAIVPRASARGSEWYSGLLLISSALLLIALGGLAITGSRQAFILALPVIAASGLILLPRRSRVRKLLAIGTGVLVLGAVLVLASAYGGREEPQLKSPKTGPAPIARLVPTIIDEMPWGSGPSSYERIYSLHQKQVAAAAAPSVAPKSDVARIAVELGLPGVCLVLLLLLGWCAAVWAAWREPTAGPVGQAASIASASLLIAALFSSPFEIIAVSSAFAACLAILAIARRASAPKSRELRPARHLSFE